MASGVIASRLAAVADAIAAGWSPKTALLKRSLERNCGEVRWLRSATSCRCLSLAHSSAGNVGCSRISTPGGTTGRNSRSGRRYSRWSPHRPGPTRTPQMAAASGPPVLRNLFAAACRGAFAQQGGRDRPDPFISAGSYSGPALRIPATSGSCGNRWSSRMRTVSRYSSSISRALGSFPVGGRPWRPDPILERSFVRAPAWGPAEGEPSRSGPTRSTDQGQTKRFYSIIFFMLVSYSYWPAAAGFGLRHRDDHGAIFFSEIFLGNPLDVRLGHRCHLLISQVDQVRVAEVGVSVRQRDRAAQRTLRLWICERCALVRTFSSSQSSTGVV